MLDHRMRHIAAELLVDAQKDRPRLRAFELELAFSEIGFDPVEADQEIGLPRGAAIFPVGDRFEPGRLLLLDQCRDLAILDRLELSRRDRALLALRPSVLQRRRPQEAADVVGTERRLVSLTHGLTRSYCLLSSCRTSAAPSTIASIFPNATSRGRYFMPQSGATTIRSGGTNGSAARMRAATVPARSEEHTSELQSRPHLVCRLLLEKKKKKKISSIIKKKKKKNKKKKKKKIKK